MQKFIFGLIAFLFMGFSVHLDAEPLPRQRVTIQVDQVGERELIKEYRAKSQGVKVYRRAGEADRIHEVDLRADVYEVQILITSFMETYYLPKRDDFGNVVRGANGEIIPDRSRRYSGTYQTREKLGSELVSSFDGTAEVSFEGGTLLGNETEEFYLQLGGYSPVTDEFQLGAKLVRGQNKYARPIVEFVGWRDDGGKFDAGYWSVHFIAGARVKRAMQAEDFRVELETMGDDLLISIEDEWALSLGNDFSKLCPNGRLEVEYQLKREANWKVLRNPVVKKGKLMLPALGGSISMLDEDCADKGLVDDCDIFVDNDSEWKHDDSQLKDGKKYYLKVKVRRSSCDLSYSDWISSWINTRDDGLRFNP